MIYQIQTDKTEINSINVDKWVQEFITYIQPRRIELGAYYDGMNTIEKQGAVQGRPNYSINVNMAKYITDVATSYVFGHDITYSTEDENVNVILDKIEYINKNCDSSDIDFHVGGDMSAFGIGYQLVLVPDGIEPIEDRVKVKRLNPLTTFMVVDNSILRNPLCAVYFYQYKVKESWRIKCYVYDNTDLYIFDGGVPDALVLEDTMPHNMGQIPIIECLNNDDAFGDYEVVKDLLDALSLSISNNTDDLQSIANAILTSCGGQLNKEQIEIINKYKVANLPVGASMAWVIKNINHEANKQHLDNILKFIFQISQVPDLTDDAFGGQQSGVAMQYKLWGVNQLWATKTKKYKKSVYERLKIFLHLLQYQIGTQVDLLNNIDVQFYKNLPTDKSEEYEMIKALKGTVSEKTLLENISIVDDVDAEMEQIKKEQEETADMYGFENNQNLNNEERTNTEDTEEE